jgi:hypothetical protein
MADAKCSTLGALIAPRTAVEFLRDYWPGKSLVAAFIAKELCERFPAFAFDQHRQLLEAAARAGLVRLLWFPRLSAAA